jgi:hypothetical protein
VLTLQTVLVLATGSVLLFLLQFPMANLALFILFARTAPAGRPLVAKLAAERVSNRARMGGLKGSGWPVWCLRRRVGAQI